MKPASLERSSGLLLLGATFGLLTGFGELAFLAARKFIRHKFLFMSPEVVWMTPAAELVVFTAVVGVLVLLRKAGIRRMDWRVVTGVCLFLATLGVALMYPPLSRVAALILALGVGVQGARIAPHFRAAIERWTPRIGATLAALVLAAGLGLNGWYLVQERRMLARLGSAGEGHPNVLLIVLDTVRSLNLSLYGYDQPTTPNLERRAAQGVVFTRAFATAPWTFPSHATMFTGRLPHELTASWMTPLDQRYPTLAELLARRGYLTAGFAANTLYCTRETGLSRGFQHWSDYLRSPGEIARSASLSRTLLESPWFRRMTGHYELLGRKTARDINHEFLDWLGQGKDRPFFVFLNYFDAHGPYLPPEPFASRFRRAGGEDPMRRFTEKPKRGVPDQAVLAEERDAYDGALAWLDQELEELFQELARRGALDNTVVIVTSDHGEEFGEHGLMGHGNSLYRPSVQVPLVLWGPGGIARGVRVNEPVSLRDLAATIMDAVDQDDTRSVPGRSLARFWDGSPMGAGDTLVAEVAFTPRLPAWYPVSKGNLKSVIAGGWRYIRNGDGRPELYDFERDTMEVRDLSGTAEGAGPVEQFHQMLVAVAGDTVGGPR